MHSARFLSRSLMVLLLVAFIPGCGQKSPTFIVNSPSMEPTFAKGDRLEVSPVPSALKAGMVIVFTVPDGWSEGGASKSLKRIVGIGGDQIACCDANGWLTINDEALDESSYLPNGTLPSEDSFDVRVPEGYLWVMGDNRVDSADSRVHMGDPGGGFVAERLVIGVVKDRR